MAALSLFSFFGFPRQVAYGRTVGQTGAVASIAAYTVGTSDGSFLVSGNVLVTASSSFSFALQVTYTDEGNTSRTQTMLLQQPASSSSVTIANAAGAVPYCAYPAQIRAKAGTAITVLTSGTFSSVTYNAEALIQQVQ